MKSEDTSADQSLERILEAVLSVSEAPLSIAKMRHLFPEEGRPRVQDIEAALESLEQEYERSALELIQLSNGFRFQTRSNYAQWINKLFETRPPKLSRAVLETLAIIAYQQPVTRGDIQEIRGVAVSSDIIQRLLEREWIKKIGERDIPGRPSLFGTTANFLAYFGLSSLAALPELHEPRELDEITRELGQVVKQNENVAEDALVDNARVDNERDAQITKAQAENTDEVLATFPNQSEPSIDQQEPDA